MPELPEVETVKRILQPQIAGRTITNIVIHRPQVVKHPTADAFANAVKGLKITGMARRGKFPCILLEGGAKIVVHLRMTGTLLLTPSAYPEEKHTHLVLQLNGEEELRFIDPRRFGRLWFFGNGEPDDKSGMSKLGPEPFDSMITAEYLAGLLSGRKRSIKGCLLDQEIIAGIGNIYSDEILFAAKIRPDRAADTLSPEDWQQVAKWIPVILQRAVEASQITPEEYLKGKGHDYRIKRIFQVYGRAGKPCKICGETLYKAEIAGRSSVYCLKCQK